MNVTDTKITIKAQACLQTCNRNLPEIPMTRLTMWKLNLNAKFLLLHSERNIMTRISLETFVTFGELNDIYGSVARSHRD